MGSLRGRTAQPCPLWAISGHFAKSEPMSALPAKADIVERGRHVRFVPIADIITSFDHLLSDRKHTRRDNVILCLQKPALPVSRLQRFPKKQQRMATDAPLSWRNV